MRSLLDVNVLLALHDPDHFHGEVAHEWWAANISQGWASCPISENGFVRISSGSAYSPQMSLTPHQSVSILNAFRRKHDHCFWADDISLTNGEIFSFDQIVGPRQLTDIYLLALAVKNGGRLVTFDRRVQLSAVIGAKEEHLQVLSSTY